MKNFSEIGSKALELIRQRNIPHQAFYHGNAGISKYFEYLSSGRFEKIQPNTYVETTLTEDRWFGQKATTEEKAAINAIKEELRKRYEEIKKILSTRKESYTLAKLLAKTIFPLALLNEIEQVLNGFKRQQNLVHISEFNTRIARIVLGEPIPFIYERLGERYRHILIDEFQDTSHLQWQNFVPLIENALAAGYFNLVVGDGKQAIYRWRNGDVTQFTSLPFLAESRTNPIIRQREQVLKDHYKEEKLNYNYRSAPGIIDFNNRFFRFLSADLDESLRTVFEELEQKPGKPSSGGYIRLTFLNPEKAGIPYDALTGTQVIRILESLTKDDYRLEDIAILCRKNVEASLIARELMSNGWPVVSSESLLLIQSPEVLFLIGFVRSLFEGHDPILQASLANYLFGTGKINAENLNSLINLFAVSTWSGETFLTLLREQGYPVNIEELLSLPVYDLFEELIRVFALNVRVDPYLQFLLDAILNFAGKGTHTAYDFIEWWELHKDRLSVVMPEGMNAIHIMTIHKAKGLEFPVVIFPYANEQQRITRDRLWIDLPPEKWGGLGTAFLKTEKLVEQTPFKELYLEEERKSMLDLLNLLYVVLTRPEQRLYILTSPPPENFIALKSLPGCFAGYLKSIGLWSQEKDSYEFGIPEKKTSPESKTGSSDCRLSSFISANWRKRIHIRARAPEIWNIDEPDRKADFGNKVHTILANIYSSEDADRAINKERLSGMLDFREEKIVRDVIQKVIHHSELKSFFSRQANIRTEPDIIRPDGQSYRPDRIVFQEDEVMLLEYKTGRKSDRHREQVIQYKQLLHEMGYRNVSGFLVYLDHKITVLPI